MFIYIAGNSIEPAGSYQQATRCRNIRTLYYFGVVAQREAFYGSLDDVKAGVEDAMQASRTFNTLCTYIDEFDEVKIVRNTFFELYCYNEFMKDAFETNKIKHFEIILKQNGFKLSSQGSRAKLGKEIRRGQSQLVRELNEQLFEEYLSPESTKSDPKFVRLFDNIMYLSLPWNDPYTLIKYRDIILDKWKIKDHDAVIRFLKSNEYIESKMIDLDIKGIDLKNLKNRYHKLKIVRQFEEEFGINIWGEQNPTKTDMSDAMYKLIRTVFRTRLPKPTTPAELVTFYGALVKSTTSRKFVNVSQGQVRLNTEFALEHLELNSFKNTKQYGFSPEAIEYFGIKVATSDDSFLDPVALGLDD